MGTEVEGRVKRVGTYVYLRPIHADVWHKPSQHCKLSLIKIEVIKKENKNLPCLSKI